MTETIKFKQLSVPVKIGIITSYAVLTIWGIVFIIGFISGITGG